MQEIFANFVSGIILLFERPIRVGDTVTINGVTGTVAKIRIRAITMIDPDRKEVIVPNKSFVTGQVINWALSNTDYSFSGFRWCGVWFRFRLSETLIIASRA